MLKINNKSFLLKEIETHEKISLNQEKNYNLCYEIDEKYSTLNDYAKAIETDLV